VPAIIDYPIVLERMNRQGFRCNYPNSGAFGFPDGADVKIRGWIGPPDPSIRPQLLPATKSFHAPYETNLTAAAAEVWEDFLPGPAWVMPMSHWHFEFHDGSREWMPSLLWEIQLQPKQLEDRADGSAIELMPTESAHFLWLVEALLKNLRVSDFLIAFPGHPLLCTLHHHKQLWWTTTDADLLNHIQQRENRI
jgi:hypothetical protein